MADFDLNRHNIAVAAKEERERRENADQIQAIHARRAAEANAFLLEQQRQQRRDSAEIEAANERRARAQSQADALQKAQFAWAQERTKLQAEVDELRRLLASARGLVLSEPLAEARTAAADVTIYEPRLALAERVLAQHMRNQPPGGW